jgi:hypothetical protein
MATHGEEPTRRRTRRPPATTPEARENQLIALAVDLAEQQLAKGTASAQVITHYLKLGTTRERLEQEKIRNDNLLTAAKIQNLESNTRIEELYADAIKAMRRYQGEPEEDQHEE